HTKGHPKGHTKGLPQGATPRGRGKGQGEAIAVAGAVAVAVAVAGAGTETERQSNRPPTSRSRTARETSPPPREDEGTTAAGEPDELPALAIARRNIVAIHGGTEDPVEIEGHKVGVGIEVNAFRALCGKVADPPDIIARAIAYLPEVTGLEPPVSLARWAAEDGPAVFEQCLARAYGERRGAPADVHVAKIPPEDVRVRDAKQRAREQLAGLRRAAEA
ncbi:MAG: hypothetical protein OEW52_00005, partial [Thermoleophilia bacterium]|nr:hypothetical protein [Thermoleophilia bacterium]